MRNSEIARLAEIAATQTNTWNYIYICADGSTVRTDSPILDGVTGAPVQPNEYECGWCDRLYSGKNLQPIYLVPMICECQKGDV